MTARAVRRHAGGLADEARVPGKAERQAAILDIVEGRAIRTQEELAEALRDRGLEVTQATVSRDLRELGLARVADGEGSRYVATVHEAEGAAVTRVRNALREHVRSIEFVDVLGVVRTRPSTAPLVAAAIDGARYEEVAGTVAGDDTVLVITRGRQAAAVLGSRLRAALGRRGGAPAPGATSEEVSP